MSSNSSGLVGRGPYSSPSSVSTSNPYSKIPPTSGNYGVVTSTTKSGLIAKLSGVALGTIPSEKLGNFCIKY